METIGIDHGNAAMKTRSFCFPAGVAEYEHEPYTRKDVLKYNGKYYVCGTGRQPFLRDKTADQRYYLLTLAAMAKELEKRKLPSPAGVRIAAGLRRQIMVKRKTVPCVSPFRTPACAVSI